MSEIDKVDLLVIGAGWFGLAGAKTYLQVHPHARIIILTDNATIGGVWSNERLYPGLKTNNMLGTFEYSGFPMTEEKYGVKPGEYIPASVVHDYLEDFAREYDIYDTIRFESRALRAEHCEGEDGGWIVTVGSSISPTTFSEYKIHASKLIVATGLTSQPFIPPLPGLETFTAPLFHIKEFPSHLETLETSKTICVFGGAKSAYDMAYAYASKGIHVDWIIRESGHGPGWMSESYGTPLKLWIEKLVSTRIITWFSPCIYGDYDGYATIRSWLHGTSIGRWFVDKYWENFNNDITTVNNYDAHPETAKLKPWSNAFFVGSMLSILNHDTDIFDLVRKGTISVHIADITNLTANTVSLSNGTRLKTDTFICATGWKHIPPLEFHPPTLDLGLPHTYTSETSDSTTTTTSLITTADHEILTKFPRLKHQPPSAQKAQPMEGTPEKNQSLTPFRLYRFMIPPSLSSTRDIAFMGCMASVSTAFASQSQALWTAAFFSNQVSIPADIEYQTILHSRFAKWRYPSGFGARYPDTVFDGLPYYDMLLHDIGLRNHRKSNWFWEIFEPYSAKDYAGLVDELKAKMKAEKLNGSMVN